jgi:hypothetical protein
MHPSLSMYAKEHDRHSVLGTEARARAGKRRHDAIVAVPKKERASQAKARAAEIEAAYEAVSAGTATQAQRDLVIAADHARRRRDSRRGQQSTIDRIWNEGFQYPGSDVVGLVAGKAYQSEFTLFGLPSEQHPFLKRFVASCGAPKRRDPETGEVPANALRTGPRADQCWHQHRQLAAHDEVYAFFSVNCIDIWRHDMDAKPGQCTLFRSEEDAISWFHSQYSAGELDYLPAFGVYTPDERYPGIQSLHVYYVLPDDGDKKNGDGSSAVWRDQPKQMSMLEQVQAALNVQLDADPGGLANMYHGKHPCAPNNRWFVINDTHVPTLGEMFDTLPVGYGRREMAGIQGRKCLARLSLDPEESNSFFTVTSEEARHATRSAYKEDRTIYGTDEHAERAFTRAWDALMEHVKVAGSVLPLNAEAVLHDLLEGCIAWAIKDFDPDKVNKSGRNPGAAAHLILPTDDKKTRIVKGQGVGAASKVRHSKRLIADAIAEIEAEAGKITETELSRRTGLHRKTCGRHMFTAHLERIANAMVAIMRSTDENTQPSEPVRFQGGVWGVTATGQIEINPSKPAETVIERAQHPSDVPRSWCPPDPRPWRHAKLLKFALALSSGQPAALERRHRAIGANVIDFLTSGPVTRYAPASSLRGSKPSVACATARPAPSAKSSVAVAEP